MSKQIPLTQGKFALVDDDMFDYLNQWKWCADKGASNWYAVRGVHLGEGRANRKQCKIKMHRQLLNVPKGMDTDHQNGNGLDNRICNLRICSRRQNNHNRKPKKGKYKGVNLGGRTNKWQARITINGKRISLGYYKKKENAAKAYNVAAIKHFGSYARINLLLKNKT